MKPTSVIPGRSLICADFRWSSPLAGANEASWPIELPEETRRRHYRRDDNVYHERRLIWRTNAVTSCMIAAPDLDVCAESFSELEMTVECLWRRFQVLVKRWTACLPFCWAPYDNEFKKMTRSAIGDLKAPGQYDESWLPRHVRNMASTDEKATSFLGRVLVPRRIGGRRGGGLSAWSI